MDDSIIAIIAAVAIGLVQLVASVNKKKRAQERLSQTRMQSEWFISEDPEMDMEEAKEPETFLKKYSLGVADPVTTSPIDQSEEECANAEESFLDDFTPEKAIIFSEVLKTKWNS
ncbi:MAG: hypothetical protein LBC84_06325 [Prevotellaceae bacterium]|jgi:hypothetical protein|nr:hypothetical protein [Prevotellaceae bacterium]